MHIIVMISKLYICIDILLYIYNYYDIRIVYIYILIYCFIYIIVMIFTPPPGGLCSAELFNNLKIKWYSSHIKNNVWMNKFLFLFFVLRTILQQFISRFLFITFYIKFKNAVKINLKIVACMG